MPSTRPSLDRSGAGLSSRPASQESNPEHVLSVVVKAWLSDRWVASNSYPLSRLTKEPQSFLLVGKRKPNEKKNDKINALRAEKARLIAARDYDGAQRVADRLSALR